MLYFYFCHYSQTDPTPENRAANGLSEENQLRNIRKVQVNAQVTFAIYILETLALVSVFVFWFMIRKNEISMTISFISFYVILPYTFLMNTDYNKNLVTEYGFFNTIRNALRFPCNGKETKENQTSPENNIGKQQQGEESVRPFSASTTRKETKETQTSPEKENGKQQQEAESVGPLSASKTRVKEIRISLEDKLNYSSIQSPDIFIVSRSEENAQWAPRNENDAFNLSQDPCPSNYIDHVSHQERTSTSEERNTSTANDETWTSPINRHLYLAEIILSRMVAYMNNEMTYIHYLKELVRLEKENDQNGDDLKFFEITSVDKCHVPKLRYADTLDAPLNHEEAIIPSIMSTKAQYDAFDHTNASNANFLGRFLDRTELRKRILCNIQIKCMNSGSYEEMFNELMDLEEGFVM